MASPFDLDLPDGSLRVVEAALATAGGLALFFMLVPRRRRLAGAVASLSESGAAAPDVNVPPPAAGLSSPDGGVAAEVLPDEATLPRWLRPSVQEARYGRRRID